MKATAWRRLVCRDQPPRGNHRRDRGRLPPQPRIIDDFRMIHPTPRPIILQFGMIAFFEAHIFLEAKTSVHHLQVL